ncbi:MAG: hypothetical protein GWP62_04295 [Gammaproteobacteria bacterium]|jgi:hypothetical protein|nr:hypothetical protein [Gammaproteobacteria bacterium]
MRPRLSEWASIAEIIGAVAIVISLVFVGLQVNDSNREARAATVQAALDAELAFQAELLRYGDIWVSVVLDGDREDRVKLLKGKVLYNMAMTLHDNRFQMTRAGYMSGSGDDVRAIVSMPFYEIWRKDLPAKRRSPEFLSYADSLREIPAIE